MVFVTPFFSRNPKYDLELELKSEKYFLFDDSLFIDECEGDTYSNVLLDDNGE